MKISTAKLQLMKAIFFRENKFRHNFKQERFIFLSKFVLNNQRFFLINANSAIMRPFPFLCNQILLQLPKISQGPVH